MGFFSGLRKKVKKFIPKEIRPFVPYLAAGFIPGGAGIMKGISGKFLTAAGTKILTDDEADLKDALITGTLAAGPTAINQKLGSLNEAGKLPEFMTKFGKGKDAQSLYTGITESLAPDSFMGKAKMLGAQAGVDYGIKAAELNKEALEKYNRDLARQGINDKAGRRAAIRAIYEGTGTWDMDEVDDMLDTYGYRTGGRVGYEDGDAVDGDVDRILKKRKKKTISMEDLVKDTILDNDDDLEENIEMALDGYNRLYPEIEAASIRPLSFEDGGSVDDRLMERVKELQDEGLDFASALAQAMKEDMASGKARGGIMDGIDVNMREQIDTPRGDMMIDENMEVADSSLMDAYEIYRFDMMEQGLEPMSIEEFRDQAMAESQMASMEAGQEATLEEIYIELLDSGMNPEDAAIKAREIYNGMSSKSSSGRTMAAEGGLMNLGGKEMDLRGGGFVPMGAKERADDVPARLSKNEFVMTADAVRAAGGGSVQKGADLMYDQMKQLEAKA